jgi:hypothetical protein
MSSDNAPDPAQGGKIRYWIAGLAILLALSPLLDGGALLGLVAEGLHLLLETLEMTSEHLLEFIFGFSTRLSQGITAWLAVALLVAFCVYAYRKIKAWLSHVAHRWNAGAVRLTGIRGRNFRIGAWSFLVLLVLFLLIL